MEGGSSTDKLLCTMDEGNIRIVHLCRYQREILFSISRQMPPPPGKRFSTTAKVSAIALVFSSLLKCKHHENAHIYVFELSTVHLSFMIDFQVLISHSSHAPGLPPSV